MRRRQVIPFLGFAAIAWPFVSRAQQSKPLVGFIHEGSPTTSASAAVAFREGLAEAGFAESRNVAIEYRWANGQYERLPALVDELIRRKVAVIAGGGGPRSVSAAKVATASIPIVFTVGVDPVEFGLVSSLGRPEANVTGVTMFTTALTAKRLELLLEMVPRVGKVAVLLNPNNPNFDPQVRDLQQVARSLGLEFVVARAGADGELNVAFADLVRQNVGALIVGADPFLSSRGQLIAESAARHRIPAIYQWRHLAELGGLMSYGSSNADAYRQTGVYVGRILKGARPADLPVLQPAKFELVINRKAAKALGLKIPQSMLLRADHVIE